MASDETTFDLKLTGAEIALLADALVSYDIQHGALVREPLLSDLLTRLAAALPDEPDE